MLEPTFRIDLEDVVEGFDSMNRKARNLRPAWRVLKPVMKKDIRENFRAKAGSGGGLWEKRAKSTKARHGRRGRILGKLRTAYSIDYEAKVMAATSKVPWSGVHQDGGTAGNGARIPKREHMYVSDEFIGLVVQEITNHILRGW